MITNNYKKFLKSYMLFHLNTGYRTGSLGSFITPSNAEIDIVKNTLTSGSISQVFNQLRVQKAGTSGSYGIGIGSGTTPPTENDIELASPMFPSGTGSIPFRMSFISLNCYLDGTKYCLEDNFTLTNNGNSDITVRELGLFMRVGTSGDSSIMLDRTLLDEPVILPTGGIAVPFKYTLKYDWGV